MKPAPPTSIAMPALPTFVAPPVNCGSDVLLVALGVREAEATAEAEVVGSTGARVVEGLVEDLVEVSTESSDVEEESSVALSIGVSAGRSDEISVRLATGMPTDPVGEGNPTVGTSGIRETEIPNASAHLSVVMPSGQQ